MVESKKTDFLKSNELGKSGGGFLSGLGFAQKEEEVVVSEDTTPVVEDSTVSTEDFLVIKKETAPVVHRERDTTSTRERSTYTRPTPQAYRKNKPKPQHGGQQKKHVPTPPVKVQPVRKPKQASVSQNLVKKDVVTMSESISVKEFSEKMWVPLPEVMKKLLANKILVAVHASLDFDTASLIAEEFGVSVKKEGAQLTLETFSSGDLQAILASDKDAEHTQRRAPIVTVMWHVDHGKTSLLDYLRKTAVATKEAGGITQSIGASVIDYKGDKITFIDTPGHELFTTLRARGAKLTNVAVIVIAADDGIMPQTKESIEHAKAAGVPIIVAVTKIDKPNNNFEKIKNDIGIFDLIPEDWGGDVPVIGVSSITGQGIDDLLENILLQTEMLDLQYNPTRPAVGVVVDAHKDQKKGVVSSLIILTGTLKQGDIIVAYNTYGKVRHMQDWKWDSVKSVSGGDPVQILGLSELPEAGRIVEVVSKEKEAQQKIAAMQEQELNSSKKTSIEQFLSDLQTSDKTELRLILKADGASSLEALVKAVEAIPVPDNVHVKILMQDVWQFTESDLALAQASKALMLGFNIHIPVILKKKMQALQLTAKTFDIIYELTDYLTQLTQGMIEKEYEEVYIGRLDVLGVFFRKAKEMVIWGKVLHGVIKNGAKFKVMRIEAGERVEIVSGTITSLQKDKNNVKEVPEGHECGMKVKVGKKIEEGDWLDFYEEQEKLA
jgi:translation initiation factor IF-2